MTATRTDGGLSLKQPLPPHPVLDDLFHGCAWAAFVELARECQGWPESRAVKERAYALYEEALAEKDRG